MQFISKTQLQPENWVDWFTTDSRVEEYSNAGGYGKKEARKFLINEQHQLCAYCQGQIQETSSSIEHIVPDSKNIAFSTLYHNLIAVCTGAVGDRNGNHCDKSRGSEPLFPMVFYKDAADVEGNPHAYLCANYCGRITAKQTDNPGKCAAVQAFIDVLNLNQGTLVERRKTAWHRLLGSLPLDNTHRNSFLKMQYQRIQADQRHEFRQFLLILIRKKLGGTV